MNKDFRRDPASAFMSVATQEEEPGGQTATESADPYQYKLKYNYGELRTRRLQLVLQPSLYKAISKAAKAQGISLNEYCSRAFKRELDAERK